ncbi:MAG TPA: hypothetical protein VGM89_15595 [Puia sp.]|jgi:hypothetical protein
MNQDIATLPADKIDDLQFGDLIQMPAIYEKNKTRVINARAYTDSVLATVAELDLTKVDGVEMEALMTPVRECEVLLAEAEAEINGERKPHTQKMDAIKKLFTGLEGDLSNLRTLIRGKIAAWETEKISRQKKAEKDTQLLADKAEERVRIRTAVISALNNQFSVVILREILGLNEAFNKKSAEELNDFGVALADWEPEMPTDIASGIMKQYFPPLYLSADESNAVRDEVVATTVSGLAAQWVARINEDKVRLIETIPSRITELQEAATNQAAADAMAVRQANEAATLTSQVKQEAEARQDAVVSNQQAETMNAVAEVAAKATPVVQLAAGTSQKRKYKVTSHQGIVALLQFYIKFEMKNLTVDEINTKFSFIRTACDKRLNGANAEVIQSPGLEVVEDVTVRRGSKTA